MSNVTRIPTWSKEKLNTFTRTDITMVVLLPPTCCPGWCGLQHDDLGLEVVCHPEEGPDPFLPGAAVISQ